MLPSYERSSSLLVLIFSLPFELIASAMVLPRPPSSSFNHLVHDHRDLTRSKIYFPFHHHNGKSFPVNVVDNVNSRIDKPQQEVTSNDDLRLFEIALQGPDDMETMNLQNLVQMMLKNEQADNEKVSEVISPEVIPRSILGVRNIDSINNLRFNENDHDKIEPKITNFDDDKLYYLKKKIRPKVYIKVRGRSGDFTKENQEEVFPSSKYYRMTPGFEKNKILLSSKSPKKYGIRDYSNNEVIGVQASAYGLDDLSTTENSMVTSSELPKQIPAPPSKILGGRISFTQTTPVHNRFPIGRTDTVLSAAYTYSEE